MSWLKYYVLGAVRPVTLMTHDSFSYSQHLKVTLLPSNMREREALNIRTQTR